MSAAHPIFARMFADMGRMGLLPKHDDLRQIPVNDETRPSPEEVARVQHAIDLRKARLRREAKERERREAQRAASSYTPPEDAA